MTDNSEDVGYYLVKDLPLSNLFSQLVERTQECYDDFDHFISYHAPGARLHTLRTEGNLQIRFMAFTWIFNNKKNVPADTYKEIELPDGRIITTPDISKPRGILVREEQMELLDSNTSYCHDIWSDELAPMLGWKLSEEPYLLFDNEKKIFILVSNKIKPHGSYPHYRPPHGVIKIDKAMAHELLSTLA